jgi:hypothetical protein
MDVIDDDGVKDDSDNGLLDEEVARQCLEEGWSARCGRQ